ncbi:MAG: beta-lactamase family protein [Paludibacteraceae bacterium]|nr:beta-lactamase family protein [Paludibacteraceae bacterium]
MFRRFFFFLFSLCLVSCGLGSHDVPQEFIWGSDVSDAFDLSRLSRIDSAFQGMVDDGLLPNAVTLVVHRGRVVHHAAYGWRDKDKGVLCERDDIFRIASQTKAVAVVGLMMLWEEGRFQLDDPIKRYLPYFDSPCVLVDYDSVCGICETRPADKDITIRHLLTHTSGISYRGVHGAIAQRYGVPTLNSLDSVSLADMVEGIARLPLAHNPGEAFTYSMNTDVLGRLIEVLSGQPVDVYLRERIFEPLGMVDTYFYLPREKESRLVKLYTFDTSTGAFHPSDHPVFQTYPYAGAKMLHSTGAGLCGTIEDYGKFCQMVLNGGVFNGHRLLGRKTLELMQRNAVGDLRGDIGFGLAWDVFRPEYLHHTVASEGSMRWGGMFTTDYLMDPQEDLLILFYTNVYPAVPGIRPKELMHNLVYQALL